MSDSLRIVEGALLDEAGKWSGLSSDMADVRRQMDGLPLMVTAFFANDLGTAQAAKKAYDDVLQRMTQLAAEAAAEFNQVKEALHRVHEQYENVDGKVAHDLSEIYGK